MDTPDIHLPAFFNPILDYLSSTLPEPVYSTLLTICTHSWSLITSLFTLVTLLISSAPSTWDAQTILPPLITLLMAYLALVSFYRTTGWMLRTGFWFAKWGSIFALLTAGAGWFMGNAHANGGQNGVFDGRGLIPTLGGFVLDMINGQGQNAAGGNRRRPSPYTISQSASSSSRSRKSKQQSRPKAWDSWDQHREWQYQENNAGPDGADVQNVIGDILGAAGHAIRESGWWETAKTFVDNLGKERDEDGAPAGTSGRQPDRKAKTKAKTGSR